MPFTLLAALGALALFVAMLALLELGSRMGARQLARNLHSTTGTGAMEGAVFALLGLLLAFTFSGAASRFDDRRALIVEEANAIGTAYLRLDLLPPSAQPALRDAFRRYVEHRIAVYRVLPNVAASKIEEARVAQLQRDIWAQATAASATPGGRPSLEMLLLPALNEMIDITTTRAMARQMHPPPVLFGLLFALMLGGAFIAGYGMAASKTRNWLYRITFALSLAGSAYLILDLEYPRAGLIRVDAFDQALVEVRQSMK